MCNFVLLIADYVGSVQYVTGIQHSLKATQGSIVWRDIGVQNLEYVFHLKLNKFISCSLLQLLRNYNSGHTVRFTLWNQDAHTFRQAEYEKAEKPVIIAVRSCLVKNYGVNLFINIYYCALSFYAYYSTIYF